MQTYSISKLSELLSVDRRTLKKVLATTPPDASGGRGPEYKLETVQAVLNHRRVDKVDGSLKEQKLSEEVRRLRLQNDLKEGKLVARSAVAEEFVRLFGPVVSQVEQKLVNEYPSAVAGLDVPQARIYGKRVLDFILEAHRKAAEAWKA